MATSKTHYSSEPAPGMRRVSFPSANAKGDGLAFVGGKEDSKIGVVCLQEWWGANKQIQEQALGFFGDFAMVLVPDIYRGTVVTDAEEAGHVMSGLDFPGAVQDIAGAVQYLRSQGKNKIFVTGFCMGGALTIAAGINAPGIDAIAPFYGIPDGRYFDPSKLKIPVQAHFGKLDALKGFSDPEAANGLEENLKKAGVPYEFYRYDQAGHGFTNHELHKDPAEVAAASLARTRVREFFQKHASS